jgi:hypothetical protein
VAVDVLGDPTGAQVLRRLVQAVFREPAVRAQVGKRFAARLPLGSGNGTGSLPCWVSLHTPQALGGLGKQGIVELAGAFEMRMQVGRLLGVHRAVAG